MKVRVEQLFLACAAGALILALGPMMPEAIAQSAVAAEPVAPAWWYHGYIEAGGRFFLNNPARESLAKYYEYSSVKPGPFLNGHFGTGSSDGLYQVDLWAKNVGYSDERYNVDLSKAGEHYLSFEWDQTPHVYSTNAQTIYNGVGSNHLTLPAGLSNTLFTLSGNTQPASNRNLIQSTINANTHQTDVGIRRDTAAVDYRWTPTDAWDVHVNYNHMHRTGTQVEGVVFSPGTAGVVSQVTKPVDDTTQNYGINGEYAGTAPWGQKFTFKLGYEGSSYQDASNSYLVDNPFCPTGAVGNVCARTGQASSPVALMSLWPDNQANGFNATLGADLPWKSRYMGTVNYTMMRQNEAFLPFTANANTGVLINGQNPASVAALPAASLNGAINTLMVNNVLTTQITPELKSKLSYRYYGYDNDTPEILVPDWIVTDTRLASVTSASYAPVRSIAISYTKQNAGAELNWRPTHRWNFGAAYGYEKYDWTRADVDVTNENSGKVFADWKATNWLMARASWLYSQRRYDNYNYLGFVGLAQWPNPSNTRYSTAMRQFYLDNRDRSKARFSIAVDVTPRFVVTPTFGLNDDTYNLAANEVGLQSNHSWTAGAEASYVFNPDATLLFSYMREHRSQELLSTTSATVPPPPANTYFANIQDDVDTFVGGINFAVIPGKLDVKTSYTISIANNSQPVTFRDGHSPTAGQYPDVKTTWQRFDATAKYTFDDDVVQRLGWKGKVVAKLRYAWEKNSVTNWQNDLMQTYMASISPNYGYMTWLAYDNPNYNVHLLMASLSFKW